MCTILFSAWNLLLNKISEPTGYPSNIRILSSERSNLILTWDELNCYERNGPIIGYQYRLYINHTHYTSDMVKFDVKLPIQLSVRNHITVLAISIAAVNDVGVGFYSEPIGVNDQNAVNEGTV